MKGWTVVTERLHPLVAPPREVVHTSAYGVRLRLDLDDYVQRGIFYNAWEVHELNFVSRVLGAGDSVVDVGANVGIFTLVAASRVGPSGAVHSFEPVPANHQRLLENVELNGFRNVHLVAAAAGAAPGELSLGLDEDMEGGSGRSMSGFYTVGGGRRAVTAPVVALDGYLDRELPDRPIRLVKIDVEGYEPEVLLGLRNALQAHRIDLLLIEVSVYALARMSASVADTVTPLTDAGYSLFRLGVAGRPRPWRYAGEPGIPQRDGPQRGLIRGLYYGLQDLNRNFNLVALAPGARFAS